MRLKAHFQEAYLDREKLEQISGVEWDGSANNVKYGEMEYAFMNFVLATADQDAAFTELTTTNRNLSTQLRQQEDHIWAPQAELCNLKVASAMKTTK